MLLTAAIAVSMILVITAQNAHACFAAKRKNRTVSNMFNQLQVHLISDPVCSKPVEHLIEEDFRWFDKDGFELNDAEHQYYQAMKYPVDHGILNHDSWQEPWFELSASSLILDHATFLCRCRYTDAAFEQLHEYRKTIPNADWLIQSKTKWGFDFALDAVRDNTMFEVLHVEYDSYNYSQFVQEFNKFEQIVINTDWNDCADQIWQQRTRWQQLSGFSQNHWKSQYLIGWNLSELTEKSV